MSDPPKKPTNPKKTAKDLLRLTKGGKKPMNVLAQLEELAEVEMQAGSIPQTPITPLTTGWRRTPPKDLGRKLSIAQQRRRDSQQAARERNTAKRAQILATNEHMRTKYDLRMSTKEKSESSEHARLRDLGESFDEMDFDNPPSPILIPRLQQTNPGLKKELVVGQLNAPLMHTGPSERARRQHHMTLAEYEERLKEVNDRFDLHLVPRQGYYWEDPEARRVRLNNRLKLKFRAEAGFRHAVEQAEHERAQEALQKEWEAQEEARLQAERDESEEL